MKVEVKEQETFQPITLTITIESEEELCNLWHRVCAQSDLFNVSTDEYVSKNSLKHNASPGLMELWEELDELVVKHNLKN